MVAQYLKVPADELYDLSSALEPAWKEGSNTQKWFCDLRRCVMTCARVYTHTNVHAHTLNQ